MLAIVIALAAVAAWGTLAAGFVIAHRRRCVFCDQAALPGPSMLCLDHLADPE